jgi:hypothetical protein
LNCESDGVSFRSAPTDVQKNRIPRHADLLQRSKEEHCFVLAVAEAGSNHGIGTPRNVSAAAELDGYVADVLRDPLVERAN